MSAIVTYEGPVLINVAQISPSPAISQLGLFRFGVCPLISFRVSEPVPLSLGVGPATLQKS